jgi:hypothetical protein
MAVVKTVSVAVSPPVWRIGVRARFANSGL